MRKNTRFGRLGGHLSAYWASMGGKPGSTASGTLSASVTCPVFVINLERSTHRRQYIVNYLATYGLDARIFPAVDGSALDLAELQRRRIYDDAVAHERFDRSLSRGEIACTFSHLNIFQKMVDEDIPMAMVLEDDAIFAPGAESRLCDALAEAPADWEVLQLSTESRGYVPVTDNVGRFPSPTQLPVGSAGYLIRKAGAVKMLAHGFPIAFPADSFVGRASRWGVVLYGLAPSAIVQNAVFPTQIYNSPSAALKLKQALKQGLVSISGGVARAFRGTR
jgi:glycosyl transferase, family 25